MIKVLAASNYRSLLKVVLPLGRLNVIGGANGSGKSNLFRVLGLLAASAEGTIVRALAGEGGVTSVLWAGPERITTGMKSGRLPVQGGPRSEAVRLRLGFSTDSLGYAITLGLPSPSQSAFSLDPEIKRESIWHGDGPLESRRILVDRRGACASVRAGDGGPVVLEGLSPGETLFTQLADPRLAPEVWALRETIRGWRFYDQFRTDRASPIRVPQIGTRTPVLHHDGHDLAAALQTILEIGDAELLTSSVADAFPGASLEVSSTPDRRFALALRQHGLLRELEAQELSDGTLRYLCWAAALLSPRPPDLLVLNEPENSLHPGLLPPLGRLIQRACDRSQVWVVTHSPMLLEILRDAAGCNPIQLRRELGQTLIEGQSAIGIPPWRWPD
jgi:predicted ATPase